MNIGNNVEQALQVSATGLRNRASTNSTDGKELGKQDFLNLLMTQMANQDPMNATVKVFPDGKRTVTATR